MKGRAILRMALFLAVLILAGLACSFSASTANISEATLARDEEGQEPVSVFSPEDTFYLIVDLANAPADTKVRAAWTAVEVEGTEPNLFLDESELSSESGTLTFNLSNDNLWPNGTYKVDIYLNDELDQTLEFSVEG